jgi:hypothetical protein
VLLSSSGAGNFNCRNFTVKNTNPVGTDQVNFGGATTFHATGNVSLNSKNFSGFTAAGTKATIDGTFKHTGKGRTQTLFQTATLSQVKKDITVTGGWFQDVFLANSFFQADGKVTLNLKDENNVVQIGAPAPAAPTKLMKGLSITSGSGSDGVFLTNVSITGATKIDLGASADQLNVNGGGTFAGTVTVNLADGDDLLTIGTTVGAAIPINFTQKVTIKTGNGNDALAMGLDPLSGGDANSTVNFGVASTVDGGSGLNLFDGLTLAGLPSLPPSQYSGPVTLTNWTDPTP